VEIVANPPELDQGLIDKNRSDVRPRQSILGQPVLRPELVGEALDRLLAMMWRRKAGQFDRPVRPIIRAPFDQDTCLSTSEPLPQPRLQAALELGVGSRSSTIRSWRRSTRLSWRQMPLKLFKHSGGGVGCSR
jgi:hypothetical protein